MRWELFLNQRVKTLLAWVFKKNPDWVAEIVSSLKRLRRSKWLTKVMGPLFRPDHRLIEIDITYSCNLRCLNCCRSCRQASSDDQMSLSQIEKFIKESVAQKRRWKRIRVLGGEPTMHPQLFEILNALLAYKKSFSKRTQIILVTNGFGEHVQNVLVKVPGEVVVENTSKTSVFNAFEAFNDAPLDDAAYKEMDFSNGCSNCQVCGIGLNKYGYYPCATGGGGVDRVLGLNIGRKSLPRMGDPMTAELKKLCRCCGHFRCDGIHVTDEKISFFWQDAYRRYAEEKPSLVPY